MKKRMYQIISRKENFLLPGLLDAKQTLSYSNIKCPFCSYSGSIEVEKGQSSTPKFYRDENLILLHDEHKFTVNIDLHGALKVLGEEKKHNPIVIREEKIVDLTPEEAVEIERQALFGTLGEEYKKGTPGIEKFRIEEKDKKRSNDFMSKGRV